MYEYVRKHEKFDMKQAASDLQLDVDILASLMDYMIGRGLMAEPQLLILDEPSLGLSPRLVEELFALIQRINAEGITLLLVEQNVVQCLEVARRAYVLEGGTFVLHGNAADIRADTNLKRAYLGL